MFAAMVDRGDGDIAAAFVGDAGETERRAKAMPLPFGSKARSGSISRKFRQSNPLPWSLMRKVILPFPR
jgi:hypothetical protein